MDEKDLLSLHRRRRGKEAEVSNFISRLNYGHPNIRSSKRRSHGWSCWCGFHVFMKYAEFRSQ